MRTCNNALRAMGILIGAWGVAGSLFFTFAFTFREDAWQIFGGTMLIIITMLGEFIGFIGLQCWINDVDRTIVDNIRNHFKQFHSLRLFRTNNKDFYFCSLKYFGVCGLAIWSSLCEFLVCYLPLLPRHLISSSQNIL